MGKITGYDSHASTQVPRTHSGVDDTQKKRLPRTPPPALLPRHVRHGQQINPTLNLQARLLRRANAHRCRAHAIVSQLRVESGGINLKQMGVRPGQRWCVEATKWQETLKHEKESGVEVPPVKLECTHESALEVVDLEMLRKYAAASDV